MAEEPALGQPRGFEPDGLAPRHSEPDWVDRINFRVRQLTSDVALGAGTVLDIDRIEASPAQDAIWQTDEDLGPGDTYTALVYDPKPSSAEMRAAGAAYPAEARRYTTFAVPLRDRLARLLEGFGRARPAGRDGGHTVRGDVRPRPAHHSRGADAV